MDKVNLPCIHRSGCTNTARCVDAGHCCSVVVNITDTTEIPRYIQTDKAARVAMTTVSPSPYPYCILCNTHHAMGTECPEHCAAALCWKLAEPNATLCQEHLAALPAPMRGEPAEPVEQSTQRVRLLQDFIDDGADHHPPAVIAHKGEVVEVRKLLKVAVAHEGVHDQAFIVVEGEFEPIAIERCPSCRSPLPPLATWSMPHCPTCVESAEYHQSMRRDAARYEFIRENLGRIVFHTAEMNGQPFVCGIERTELGPHYDPQSLDQCIDGAMDAEDAEDASNESG